MDSSCGEKPQAREWKKSFDAIKRRHRLGVEQLDAEMQSLLHRRISLSLSLSLLSPSDVSWRFDGVA